MLLVDDQTTVFKLAEYLAFQKTGKLLHKQKERRVFMTADLPIPDCVILVVDSTHLNH